MLHQLKFMGQQTCDKVYNKEKTFEIRKNDRNYQVGDIIQPISIDEACNRIHHPIDNIRYKITYIAGKWDGIIADDYCIFSIQEVE